MCSDSLKPHNTLSGLAQTETTKCHNSYFVLINIDNIHDARVMQLVCLFVYFIFIWNAVCLELFVYEEQPIGTIVGSPVSDGYDFR